MTPERREELYNIPSSELTDAQIIEYMKDAQYRVAPKHIQSELLARFEKYSNISVPDTPEGLREKISAAIGDWLAGPKSAKNSLTDAILAALQSQEKK